MTSDAKIGLLLGLVFIFVIAFIINGLPNLRPQQATGADALKSELLSGLPVPGLEIRDGQIYVDGLPFDRVNEARRIRIAVDIAKLRAGRLGLLLVDGMERLDETSFREFVAAVRDSGLQAIVCRVDETDLVIKEEAAA